MNYKVFLIWLLLVTLWNFTFPTATPILDILVAIILSLVGKYLETKIRIK